MARTQRRPAVGAPRVAAPLAAAFLTVALAGCTNLAAPDASLTTSQFDHRMDAALASCNLKVGEPGVTLATDGSLALRPEAAGHPTSVTVVTAQCVLDALHLPHASRATFVHDSVYTGHSAASWNSLLASWYFHDTLNFKVDVVAS